MNAGHEAQAVRAGAGLFELPDRALIEVTGGDRVRWLQGQISNDVAVLGEGDGCYAALLTVKGRIVSDLHVLAREDRFWLETGTAQRDAVHERLERYIVADDVDLSATNRFARLALEGPRAADVLSAAAGMVIELESESAVETTIAGHPLLAWAFGFTNLPAVQLFIGLDDLDAVRGALLEAGAAHGLADANAEVLEILRIESGIPALGSELDEEVFPAEARLERAISTTKGCYTGQEIVERIRSRGAVNYLLVGLRFERDSTPVGTELANADGKRVGEVTSLTHSADAGAIGLGYLRRELTAPGTQVRAGEVTATVAALPFVGMPVS